MDNVTPGTYNTYLHKNTTVTQLIATVLLPGYCLLDKHCKQQEDRRRWTLLTLLMAESCHPIPALAKANLRPHSYKRKV